MVPEMLRIAYAYGRSVRCPQRKIQCTATRIPANCRASVSDARILDQFQTSLLGAVAGSFERFVSQFAGNDFLKRNIGQRHSRRCLYQRPMSKAKLTHTLGDNINQK